MRSKLKISKQIFTLLCSVITFSVLSQNSSIKYQGIIQDSETYSNIEDAIISLDTGEVVLSDEKGIFSINAREGQVLYISKMGYTDLQYKFTKEKNFTIYMKPSSDFLEEIVITKNNNINDIDIRKMTGSIVSIDMNKLSQKSEMDIMKLLQGQATGLSITTTGELGKKPKIRIRGEQSLSYKGKDNEPLFVVDGMVISSETFLTLNPSDFSEIKILKDAAASALYGIKAANGVIEMTSKKGFDGETVVIFNATQGITTRGERSAKMMNSERKLELERQIQNLNTPGYIYSEDYYRRYYSSDPNLDILIAEGNKKLDSLRAINTDWFKEIVRPNIASSYNLSARGGNEKSTFFYSANYSSQGGKMPGNDIKRLTARANLDYNLASNFTLSINSSFGISKTNTQNGTENDPVELAFNLNPYEKINTNTDIWSPYLFSYPGKRYSDLVNQFSEKTDNKRFNGSLVFRWEIIPELEFSGVIGADYSVNESLGYISEKSSNISERGRLVQDKGITFDFTNNMRLNYHKEMDNHDIFLSANMDFFSNKVDLIGIKGYGVPDRVQTIKGINQNLLGGHKTTAYNTYSESAQLGFGLAGGYTYLNTYDFYASLKRDASSLLPKNKRWNQAWATGFGWKISEYSFLRDSNILTNLKAKMSFGYTASMAGIDAADIIPTYTYQTIFYGDGRALEMDRLPNKDLNPQQTFSKNVGLDFSLLHKLHFSIGWYNNLTEQSLYISPIAPSNGFGNMKKNIGDIENKGLEFSVSGNVIRSTDIIWSSSASLSLNRNRVLKLYGTDKIYNENSLLPEMEVGKPLGIIYGLNSLGINSIDGMPRYLSSDGITELTTLDQLKRDYFVILGYETPPYTGIFNNTVSYMNFSLDFSMLYSFGGIKQYSNKYARNADDINKNAFANQLEEMWMKKGDENKKYTTPFYSSSSGETLLLPTTKTVYKTDFIRLNYIQLSYNCPVENYSEFRRYFKTLSLNLQAENIYTFRFEKDKASINDTMQPVITLGINASF